MANSAWAQADPPIANTGNNASAFTGLAQAPEANLFVGGAKMTPRLELTYSSSAGPSPYGLGWDLSLGRVQRSNKRGVFSCSDLEARDDYVLVLPTGSVECRLDQESTNYPRRCIPVVEEAFLKIELSGIDQPHWEVWDKSGNHYVFGDQGNSRTGSHQDALFVEATATDPCKYVASWGLNMVADLNGNTVSVSYLPDSGSEGALYPYKISYGANLYDSGMGALGDIYEVVFIWQLRPASDWVTNASAGYPRTLFLLLGRIDVSYTGVGARPVRSYFFDYSYLDESFWFGSVAPETPAYVGRQSYLASVSVAAGSEACQQAQSHPDCHLRPTRPRHGWS